MGNKWLVALISVAHFRRICHATWWADVAGRLERMFLQYASSPRTIALLRTGLSPWNAVAIVAVLSGTVRRARHEKRVANASNDSAQLLLAASRKTAHHFIPWNKNRQPARTGKAQIPLGSSRHVSTRSTCRASRDERVERVEPCCSNVADDEQAIVLACAILSFSCSYIHKSYLLRQIK